MLYLGRLVLYVSRMIVSFSFLRNRHVVYLCGIRTFVIVVAIVSITFFMIVRVIGLCCFGPCVMVVVIMLIAFCKFIIHMCCIFRSTIMIALAGGGFVVLVRVFVLIVTTTYIKYGMQDNKYNIIFH